MQVTTGSVVNVLIEFNESVLIKTNACLPVHNTRVVQQLNSAVIFHMLTLEDNRCKLLKEKQNKNRHLKLVACLTVIHAFDFDVCWGVRGRVRVRRLPSASSVNRRRAQEKNYVQNGMWTRSSFHGDICFRSDHRVLFFVFAFFFCVFRIMLPPPQTLYPSLQPIVRNP